MLIKNWSEYFETLTNSSFISTLSDKRYTACRIKLKSSASSDREIEISFEIGSEHKVIKIGSEVLGFQLPISKYLFQREI